MYDEQQFDEAINVLYNFGSMVRGTVEGMRTEAETCAANMGEDVVAKNASAELVRVLDRITEILDENLNTLLADLEEEKERARKAAQYEEEY